MAFLPFPFLGIDIANPGTSIYEAQGAAMTTRIKRRQYFIDRSLQYRLLIIVLSYSMIIALFVAISLFAPDIINMMNENLSFEVRADAARRMLTVHARVWPAIIALVCLIGIHSVLIFHRLVGPLHRFRWAFAKIGKGDLNFRVKLRKRDYLPREKDAFNEMLDVLTEKLGSVQLAGLDALNSLDSLEEAVTEVSGWQDTDQQLLQKHGEHLRGLLDHVRYFRLSIEENAGRETVEPVV